MLNTQKIRALKGNALTPATLRAEGVLYVVIQPNGQLAEEVLVRYLQAGEPGGTYFERHLVVSVDVWERGWLRRPPAQTFDPISGEAETPESAAGWARCAPLRVLADGGKSTTVSAADLCAYAAATGRLAAGFNSTLARMALPKGLEPVDGVEVEILTEAALAWPYDREAPSIATERRRSGSRCQRDVQPPHSSPSVATQPQVIVQRGPLGPQTVMDGSRSGALRDLLIRLFSAEELRIFLRYLPGAGDLVDGLPSDKASKAQVVEAAAELLIRRGLVNRELFVALLEERPGRGLIIQAVRDQLGV